MKTKQKTANTNKATEFIDKFGCEISKTTKCLRYYIKKTKKRSNKTKDYNSAIQYTYDFINYSYNKKKEKYDSPDTTEEEKIKITNELLNKFGELNKKHKYTFSLISSVIVSAIISTLFAFLGNPNPAGMTYWNSVVGLINAQAEIFKNTPPIVSTFFLLLFIALLSLAILILIGVIIIAYLVADMFYYSKYRNMVVPYEKEVLHKILTDIDERYSNLD